VHLTSSSVLSFSSFTTMDMGWLLPEVMDAQFVKIKREEISKMFLSFMNYII
jgi:hypothetical protein